MIVHLLSVVFLLTGCVTFYPKPYEDPAGIQRLGIGTAPDSVLSEEQKAIPFDASAMRTEGGELITDREMAETASQLKIRDVLAKTSKRCTTVGLHDNGYKSSQAYIRAISHIRNKDFERAELALEESLTYCENLKTSSNYFFLRGYIYAAQGKVSEAKASFQQYLKSAETPLPYAFQQMPRSLLNNKERRKAYNDQLMATFVESRKLAQKYIKDESIELRLSKAENELLTLKMAPNLSSRPGGSREKNIWLLPGFSYDFGYTALGNVFSLFAIMPFYDVHIAPGVAFTENFGNLYSMTVRYPFWESEARDLNLEVIARYRTQKRGRITTDFLGQVTSVTNVESSQDLGVGFGATKRFTPRFGFSGQIDAVDYAFNDDLSIQGTFYSFYTVYENLGLYTGYVQDNYQIGIEWWAARFAYDLRTKGFAFSLFNLNF